MVALPLTRRKFTPDEYLMIERLADTRSEFLDGDIYAMADVNVAHITINDNLTVEIGACLKGTPFQGMSRSMKVLIGPGRMFAYPDYLIAGEEKRFLDARTDILTNPVAVFEILSPSTEHYDRSTKFDLYKQIDSFQEYILIAQDEPRVEHWVRLLDGAWRQKVLSGLEAELALETVPASVALRDLYDRVKFAAAPE